MIITNSYASSLSIFLQKLYQNESNEDDVMMSIGDDNENCLDYDVFT